MRFSLFNRLTLKHVTLKPTSLIFKAYSSIAPECWKDINGCSKYQISSFGNVKHKRLNKRRHLNRARYQKLNHPLKCSIVNDQNKVMTCIVSRLVLKAFHPRKDQDELCVFHLDGDRYNNRLENLEWRDKANVATSHGRPSCPIRISSQTAEIEFDSVLSSMEFLSSFDIIVSSKSVLSWCRNKETRHGFTFAYQDEKRYINRIEDLKNERWKLLMTRGQNTKRWTTYFASSFGRIKSFRSSGRETLLALQRDCGYSTITIAGRTMFVHHIVAKLFIDNPSNHEMIDHIDGSPQNNTAENLRWVADNKQNYENPLSRSRLSLRRQNKRSVLQYSRDWTLIRKWKRTFLIQKHLGFRSGEILNVCRGKRKSAYGFRWVFADD